MAKPLYGTVIITDALVNDFDFLHFGVPFFELFTAGGERARGRSSDGRRLCEPFGARSAQEDTALFMSLRASRINAVPNKTTHE